MVSISGLIQFDGNNVAESINLFTNKIDGEISLDISLKKGYNKQQIKKLLQKHPLWKTTPLIPIFEKESKSQMISLMFKNADFSVESMFKIIKEVRDGVLPILDEIEPLVRMKECPTCRHSFDVRDS